MPARRGALVAVRVAEVEGARISRLRQHPADVAGLVQARVPGAGVPAEAARHVVHLEEDLNVAAVAVADDEQVVWDAERLQRGAQAVEEPAAAVGAQVGVFALRALGHEGQRLRQGQRRQHQCRDLLRGLAHVGAHGLLRQVGARLRAPVQHLVPRAHDGRDRVPQRSIQVKDNGVLHAGPPEKGFSPF